MALLQYLEEGQFSTNLETGDYKVIVIGPGGDGGIGGLGAVWLMKLKNNTTKTH